jgi:hypothetical protein
LVKVLCLLVNCDQVQEKITRWVQWNNQRDANKEKLHQAMEFQHRIDELQQDEQWKATVRFLF